MGVFAVDFRRKARNWWGLLVSNRASFEGRRGRGEGQGAGVVQIVWMGVEMWERGTPEIGIGVSAEKESDIPLGDYANDLAEIFLSVLLFRRCPGPKYYNRSSYYAARRFSGHG